MRSTHPIAKAAEGAALFRRTLAVIGRISAGRFVGPANTNGHYKRSTNSHYKKVHCGDWLGIRLLLRERVSLLLWIPLL
jgi:hypothetical protein